MNKFHLIIYIGLTFFLLFACSERLAPPRTEKEFVKQFVDAYENREIERIERLFYWEGTPDDIKEITMNMLTWNFKYHHIESAELLPYVPDKNLSKHYKGKPVVLNLEPTHFFQYKAIGNYGYTGETNSSKYAAEAPVGKKNGIFYFCGARYGTANP